MVTIIYEFCCQGCDTVEFTNPEMPLPVCSEPGPINGYVRIDYPNPLSPYKCLPDGWVYPDPYTGGCYCGKCWEKIENPSVPGMVTE